MLIPLSEEAVQKGYRQTVGINWAASMKHHGQSAARSDHVRVPHSNLRGLRMSCSRTHGHVISRKVQKMISHPHTEEKEMGLFAGNVDVKNNSGWSQKNSGPIAHRHILCSGTTAGETEG